MTVLQIETLAKDYSIDTFSIIREYLQLLFLNYLYQQKESDKICFKGGRRFTLCLIRRVSPKIWIFLPVTLNQK